MRVSVWSVVSVGARGCGWRVRCLGKMIQRYEMDMDMELWREEDENRKEGTQRRGSPEKDELLRGQ